MVVENLETICQSARQAIEQRDWNRAKQEYLKALGLNSKMPDVHYGLATVYFQLGELTSAAHHFKEVTRLDGKRAGAFVNLGAVLNLLTEYDDAINALRRGIQLDPKRTEGYYNLGLVHRRKGQLDMAIQAYREAIRLNPRLGDAHLNLANVYADKQQFRQAVAHYEQALQVRPGWAKAIDGLSIAQASLSGETIALNSAAPNYLTADDQERLVDPSVHSDFLTKLHQAAVESEEVGRHLQTAAGTQLEPAIKELSLSLLATATGGGELDDRASNFEAAMRLIKDHQKNLHASLDKLEKLEAQFAELPPGSLPTPEAPE